MFGMGGIGGMGPPETGLGGVGGNVSMNVIDPNTISSMVNPAPYQFKKEEADEENKMVHVTRKDASLEKVKKQ